MDVCITYVKSFRMNLLVKKSKIGLYLQSYHQNWIFLKKHDV